MAIRILPFPAIDGALVDYLAQNLVVAFSQEVSLTQGPTEISFAYSPPRRQYFADAILASFRQVCLKKGEWLLAILDQDIYTTNLRYLFGLADPEGRCCLISLCRLREPARDGWGRPASVARLRQRALTEAIHELGHLFGLAHCPRSTCVMFFSNSLADTDRKGTAFCSQCRPKDGPEDQH